MTRPTRSASPISSAADRPAPKGRSRFLPPGETILLAGLCVYVGVLSVAPLGRLLAEGLRPGTDGEPLGVFLSVWQSRAAWRALENTLIASVGSTVVSVLMGGGMAMLLRLTDVRGAAGLMFLAVMPMLIPPQISALAWIELLGPGSPVGGLLGLSPAPGGSNPLYGMGGIIWVMGLEHAPLVLLATVAGLKAVPRDLVEAARIAGARPPRIARSIILPIALPALAAGGVLSFVSAIGNFGVPALLGIPGRVTLLTTFIYQRLNGFGPSVLGEVAAVALVLVVLAGLGLALRGVLARRGSGALDRTGPAAAPFALGRWRLVAEGGLWLVLVLVSVLPLLALVASALVPALGVRLSWDTLTLDNFRSLLGGNEAVKRAFANSLLLAGATAVLSMLVAIPLAYLAVLRRSRVARLTDWTADAPFAVPGTVLAVGVIIVFLPPLPGLGVSLYGTLGIILVAYCARFLPLALRPASAGMELIDPALDEAGRIAGAGSLARLFRLIAPLAFPPALAGGVLIMMTALNELTVSALLWSNGTETLGVMVFFLQYEGNSPAAAALATVIIALTLALALALDAISRRLHPGSSPWRV